VRWILFAACLAACGSTSTPSSTPPPVTDDRAARLEQERVHREEVTAAHHKLEIEQQDALGATCTDKQGAHERCLPSCYSTERADPRAGKKASGPVAIEHVVCEQPDQPETFLFADELDGKLAIKPVHGRLPKARKPTTAIERAIAPMVVTGTWRSVEHPLLKRKLRCVTVTQYMQRLTKPLDACGGDGSVGCEAIGDAAARGINVVHYRLLEARRLHDAGKTTECQQAALEAIAVARGMPRWRQYAKLNVDQWTDRALYRTRFDGQLDEDALFAQAISLGTEAEQVFVACGGAAHPPTSVTDEQSFHMCW
jgi:hypothetical protein